MKLKKWIAVSYIVVMLLPILSGTLLYKLIQVYSQKSMFPDYMKSMITLHKYEGKLNNPEIYILSPKKYNLIESEDKNKIEITIYNKYGLVIYSSLGESFLYNVNKDILYQNLYKMEPGAKYYSIKKPVFDGNEIVGFYQLKLFRSDLIRAVNKQSSFVLLLFIFINLAVFFIVMHLVNKKLNVPIDVLIKNMHQFAKGESADEIPYKSKDEIGELILHFESMKEEIEKNRQENIRQQRLKEYMIAAMSHDLKTPLTSIRAYAEALMPPNIFKNNDKADYLSIIINKSDYMKNMIEDMLTYTLLTTDYKLNFVQVDGEEFFEMLFSGYDEICEKKHVHLHTEIKVNGNYNVDVKHMMRVIDNLIANAIRYTWENGNIHLGAYSANEKLPCYIDSLFKEEIEKWRIGGVIITVHNDGCGISEDEMDKIFNPFYQSDSSRNKGKNGSTGLGLSIAKTVMDKHNGKIKALSNINKNTLILCWLKEIK